MTKLMEKKEVLSSKDNLNEKIILIVEEGKSKVIQAINNTLIETYWNIGREISLNEQEGRDRADYGKQILTDLSKVLTKKYGMGFSSSNLKRMRKFYILFPDYQKGATLSHQFSWSHIVEFIKIEDNLKREFEPQYKGQVELYLNWLNKNEKQDYEEDPIKKLDLLKLYVYLIGLYKKFPTDIVTNVDLDEILLLDYYKLSKISDGNISISKGEGDLTGVGNGRGGKEEHLEGIDEIIARINDIYGIGLTEENKVMLENIKQIFISDTKLQQIAKVNSQEDFTKMFKNSYFKRGLIRQKKDFSEIIKSILSNKGLSNYLMNIIAEKVYEEMQ